MRCTRGAIVDVIVDLRPESPTYLEHVAVELSADNQRALYVPERFAHGYQVLEDITETSYQVGEFYTPEAEGGLRYDDPRLGLNWPLPVTEITEKDLAFPSCRGGAGDRSPDERRLERPSRAGRGSLMIIVDNALRAREEAGQPDPRRPDRRGLHGPGADEPDRQQRAGDGDGRRLRPSPRARSRGVPLRRPRRRRHGGDPGRAGGRCPGRPSRRQR